MGAEDMFSANLANFTGITDDVNVYVSSVVQKAVITVDEEGTEAAAASRKHFIISRWLHTELRWATSRDNAHA